MHGCPIEGTVVVPPATYREITLLGEFDQWPGRLARQPPPWCWKNDWLVEFDIKAAFDQIDHGLLLKAVRKHIKEDWILRYIERWLTAPFETAQGTRLPRDR